MGQYYNLINISKRQQLPHLHLRGYFDFNQFCCGAKMRDQLRLLGKKPFLALALTEIDPDPLKPKNLFDPIGTWAGDRIVFIGDYNEGVPPFLTEAEGEELQATIVTYPDQEEVEKPRLYEFASSHYSDLTESDFFKENSVAQALIQNFPKGSQTHQLVMNLDKKEYLDPTKFKQSAKFVDQFSMMPSGVMQGLLSLIFYSNGSGGGDVYDLKEGRWAGQHITIRDKDKVQDLESWRDISEEVVEILGDRFED
ncbi:hypothetical protein BGX26_001064 [Mortierella sp. AD094]|nr:hypothetical protein BGX26_001064 [Mortierella sp. AD094]